MAQSAESQPEEDQPEEQQTQLSIVDGQAPPLSLKALHTVLTDRGVDIPYSSLAQVIALGDIAEQLGVGGRGNRREYPRWSADFLADFLPWYTKAGIKKELAPDAVRHRLAQFRTSDNSRTEFSSSEILGSENFITRSGSVERGLFDEAQYSAAPGQLGFATRLLSGVLAPITAVLSDLTGAIRDLKAAYPAAASSPPQLPAPAPPQDRLLTAEEAAALLACNPRSVNRHVKEVLPRKWKESDVLRYIEQLTPKAGK